MRGHGASADLTCISSSTRWVFTSIKGPWLASGQGIGSWLACHEFESTTLKTRRIRERCTINLSRDQTSSRWCGSKERRVPAQVSSSSLDHGSILRSPSSKALV
ncbi:hypothetical protein TNCV_2306491 [Trichonephila clavipes]|nr:hypothetical protein TNCV_2306491 [Trichonephila clavipes]